MQYYLFFPPSYLRSLRKNYLENTETILGWLRLVEIWGSKGALEGYGIKMLDYEGNALKEIAGFSHVARYTRETAPQLCDLK